MRISRWVSLPLVSTLMSVAFTAGAAVFPGPTPVSPGQPHLRSATAYRCPTFSWSSVPGAWGYELAVFAVNGEGDALTVDPSGEALIRVTVPANASSWTPSVEQCLAAGSRYTWFVRESGMPGRSAGNWSPAASFEVDRIADNAPWSDEEMANLIARWLRSSAGERDIPLQTDGLGFDFAGAFSSISIKLNNVATEVDTARGYALTARNNAANILTWTDGIGNLSDVKASAISLKDMFDEAARLLSGPAGLSVPGSVEAHGTPSAQLFEDTALRAFYEEAVEMVRFFAAEQSAGVDSFLASPGGAPCGPGSPCATFRSELGAILENLENLMNVASELRPQAEDPRMELDQMIAMFENMPPRLIYPFYRMDQSIGLIDRLSDLDQTTADLRLLIPLLTPADAASIIVTAESPIPQLCQDIAGKEETLRKVSYGIQGVGVVVKLIGKIMQGFGETTFGGTVGPAVVTGTIETSPLLSYGQLFWGVGEVIFAMGASGTPILNNCRVLERFADLDQQLVNIQSGLPGDELDAALGTIDGRLTSIDSGLGQTGAAVQSVGTLVTTQGEALIDHDSTVKTAIGDVQRATERLDGRFDSLENGSEATNRVRIELQLIACEPLVSLYLPAEHGGQAEKVAELVRDSIDRALAAGVNTKSAEVHYDRAQGQSESGEHAKAFRTLCTAYGALTTGG
jgi:hypothetical protein